VQRAAASCVHTYIWAYMYVFVFCGCEHKEQKNRGAKLSNCFGRL
jgi:hypothetical protein